MKSIDLPYILAAYQGLLTLLVIIVGFWLKKFIQTVQELINKVNSIQIDNAGNTSFCRENHKSIDKEISRLNTDVDTLKKHTSILFTDVEVLKKTKYERV